MLDITCPVGSEDEAMFIDIWNRGIDSRLEAFTRSKFDYRNGRLCLDFDDSEVPLLIRRLYEVGTDEACSWADDITHSQYGAEI